MPRTHEPKPLPEAVTSPPTYQAVVVSEPSGYSLAVALDQIGIGARLGRRRSRAKPGPSAVIAADGPVPNPLLAYLAEHGIPRVTVLALTPQPRIVSDNLELIIADPTCHTAVAPGLALCTAWSENDLRLVVTRVKIDRAGAYCLCGVALQACLSQGDLSALLQHCPPHGCLVADPVHDTPAVIANHPLLADWVGAMLMGRNPHEAPANAYWFRRGLLPRVHHVHGNTRPIQAWRQPPSLTKDLSQATNGHPIVPSWEHPTMEATTAWFTAARSALAPMMTWPTETLDGLRAPPGLLDRLAGAVTSESLGELLEAGLKGLGLLMHYHPRLQEDIRTLQADYRLTTRDRRMMVTARFSHGRLMVNRTDSQPVKVTLIFKDASALVQLLTSPKPDLLGAMLKQQVAFEGNLNYLLKLAYLLRRVGLLFKDHLRRAACAP